MSVVRLDYTLSARNDSYLRSPVDHFCPDTMHLKRPREFFRPTERIFRAFGLHVAIVRSSREVLASAFRGEPSRCYLREILKYENLSRHSQARDPSARRSFRVLSEIPKVTLGTKNSVRSLHTRCSPP